MRNLIFDTCYWFALFNEKDQDHFVSIKMAEEFDSPNVRILIPFPSMYEVLNTDFVADKKQLKRLKEFLSDRTKVNFIDDTLYKDDAYIITTNQVSGKASLVDNVILAMLADKSLSIDGVVTFNARDFAEPCRKLQKEMICYAQK